MDRSTNQYHFSYINDKKHSTHGRNKIPTREAKKRALQHKDTGSDEHIEDSAMSDPAWLSNWIDI